MERRFWSSNYWPKINNSYCCTSSNESTEKFIDSLTIKDQKINVGSPEETAACDLVCSCTSSKEPVIPTKSVKPGAHLNLIGSFSDAQKEADSELIQNAEIFVDHRNRFKANSSTGSVVRVLLMIKIKKFPEQWPNY